MLAQTTTSIAWVILVLVLVGWVIYVAINLRSSREEIGSEIELAPNRKPYYDDAELEGPRLTRVLGLGVVILMIIVVALPLYWILEPGRQTGAKAAKEEIFIEWGAALFKPTADGGFNCSGCHGGMTATGAQAAYNVVDPTTGTAQAVNWYAPALNTIFYRYSDEEVRYILDYGRPFSPMSAWGTAGGGPMSDQKIDTLIAYLHSIQIPREDCTEASADPMTCDGGHLPTKTQQELNDQADKLVADGTYETRGEALFNLNAGSGAYSCARCHTKGWSYGQPGVPGQGAYGWNLTGGSVDAHFPNEEDMIDFVKSGSTDGAKYGVQGQGTGRMPGFGSMLTDEQVREIVEYVRSL